MTQFRELFISLELLLSYFPPVMDNEPGERGIQPDRPVLASDIRQGRRAKFNAADSFEFLDFQLNTLNAQVAEMRKALLLCKDWMEHPGFTLPLEAINCALGCKAKS